MKRRDNWVFINDPTKPKLANDEEVAYWKTVFERIAKAGFEFEFNLLYKKNMCDGSVFSPTCDCLYASDGCALECMYKEKCLTSPTVETCLNKHTAVCILECAECGHFELSCPGLNCIDFTSACVVCEKFKVDCDACPKKYDALYDAHKIRQEIASILRPTNNWGYHGKEGIAEVTTDGSLEGGEGLEKGVEITTVGKRINYRIFYEMIKKLMEITVERGAYVNERCSIHIHLLLDYYRKFHKKDKARVQTSELEKPVPQIVLANFWQLCRKYQNALVWMGMALENPKHCTRWEKFRISALEFSPLYKSMQDLRHEFMVHCEGKGKSDYGIVNLDNVRFDPNGDVSTFHVEMRQMDMVLSPSIVAANSILFYGMMVKAVELSRFGLLEIGDAEWLAEARQMKEVVLNNCPPGWDHPSRVGDTRYVKKNADYYRDQSMELIGLVKNTLIRFGPQPFEVLRKLAEKPVCFYREEGKGWDEIEKIFFESFREEDELDHCIMKLIDTNAVVDCKDVEEWINGAYDLLKSTEDNVAFTKNSFRKLIKYNLREWNFQWSDSLGAVIRS